MSNSPARFDLITIGDSTLRYTQGKLSQTNSVNEYRYERTSL